MTDADIQALYRKRLLPWQRLAVKTVSGKLADARAHAAKAVTDTLKATPDGRASAAKIRRNPSYLAALARLDELWQAIGGPAVTSLHGLVQDCTEACYRDAVERWLAETPAVYQVSGTVPTAAQVTYVRGLLWFGKTIRAEFEPAIKRAAGNLATAVSAMGQAAPDHHALSTWESQARSTLIRLLGNALADANQRADLQAMRDVIDPRFLHPEVSI